MTEILDATKKNNYNIPFVQLDNLEDIKYGKYHYNYKTVDFMFNMKENAKKTLIVFHASIDHSEKMPIFYKYNFENGNFNVLSISDKLLESARKLRCMVFLGTDEIPYDEYYIEIIKYCLILAKTQKNIFFGSSSGSFPALYYGTLFNGVILFTNGYIKIENLKYEIYKKKLKQDLNLTVKKNIDLIEHVLNNNPLHIYLYYNKNDNLYTDSITNFIIECKKKIPNKFNCILHDTVIEGKDPHDVHFPEGEDFNSVIEKI